VVKLSQAATGFSTATRRLTGRVTALTTACQMTVQSHAGESLLIQLAGISCLPPHTPTGKEAWALASLFVHGNVVVLFLSPDHPAKPLQATLFDQESVLLNRLLVRQGLVTITDDRFRPDEEEARSARRGIWQDSALRTTQHSAIAKPLSP
jgi:endonuclease YncB( thermonuclease family)